MISGVLNMIEGADDDAGLTGFRISDRELVNSIFSARGLSGHENEKMKEQRGGVNPDVERAGSPMKARFVKWRFGMNDHRLDLSTLPSLNMSHPTKAGVRLSVSDIRVRENGVFDELKVRSDDQFVIIGREAFQVELLFAHAGFFEQTRKKILHTIHVGLIESFGFLSWLFENPGDLLIVKHEVDALGGLIEQIFDLFEVTLFSFHRHTPPCVSCLA